VKPLRIAVVGGGIGGLTAAVALRRAGHQPEVYERTASFRPVGAGISVWSNGVKVLDRLGLGAEVAALGGRMDRMAYARSHDGTTLTDFSLLPLYERVGERARPMARAELQAVLLDAVGPGVVRTGSPCTGVELADDGVALHFEGGATAEADLAVAADGTHSILRDVVAGGPVERRYVGYVNWNGIVDAGGAVADDETWLTWVGDGMRASVMPIGGGRHYCFFDVPLPASALADLPAVTAGLPERFGDWAAPVRDLLDRALTAGVTTAPIHDIAPLGSWQRGRLVLLGDAAHAMAPDLGQGGCQAMEDALVLAGYLSEPGATLDQALGGYYAERGPHTADIVRRARKRADLIHGADPAATEGWYRELAVEDGSGIIEGLARSVEQGPCG
jgi:FAD-dependent urate hydroxylase